VGESDVTGDICGYAGGGQRIEECDYEWKLLLPNKNDIL
jgi:hypothetical protein